MQSRCFLDGRCVEFVTPADSGTGPAEGPGNTETARDLMVLLWALAKSEAVSPDAPQEMMGMLARSIPYQGIAAGLPGSQDAALGTAGFAENHQEAAILRAALVRNLDSGPRCPRSHCEFRFVRSTHPRPLCARLVDVAGIFG